MSPAEYSAGLAEYSAGLAKYSAGLAKYSAGLPPIRLVAFRPSVIKHISERDVQL